MKCRIDKRCLPGFKHNSEGTMVITYEFPNGIQDVSTWSLNEGYFNLLLS